MSHIPYFLRKFLPNFEIFEKFENFLQHLDSERKESVGHHFADT
jgi:hypothetical protein